MRENGAFLKSFLIKRKRAGGKPPADSALDHNDRVGVISACKRKTKKSEYPEGYSDWSECNYRTWKNPVISMVLTQQARGFILN
jgi:hypothetical protein